MTWAIIWLLVVLKIPVIAALWLVWYAIREPDAPEQRRDDGGGSDRDPHPRRPRPRPGRRGPHADPAPAAPRRVRARRRRRERTSALSD